MVCSRRRFYVAYTDYGGGGGGVGGYPMQSTYGPVGDYYYDERPEYFRPNHHVGSYPQSGPPPEVFYHEHYAPHPQHHGGGGGVSGGEGHHRPGELNIQPLLWPLAGITLLGVLSALVKTPLLLHLGSVGHRRRRRRRDATDTYDQGTATAEAIKSLLAKVYYIITIVTMFNVLMSYGSKKKMLRRDFAGYSSDARVLHSGPNLGGGRSNGPVLPLTAIF